MTLGLAASFAVSVAHAADWQQPQPQPIYIQQPQVIEEFASAWYLRGDIGVGMMKANRMEYQPNPLNPPNDFTIETSSIGNSTFIGGGVGYEFNNWLRFDATAEYRSKASVYAFGSYTTACTQPIVGGSCLDTYQGYVSSWVFLANAYVDLGTWNCFTPFVGAGFGATRNTLSDFTDVNVPTGGRGMGRNTSEWHPAWALHAGVAYNVSKTLKIELAYRYLDLGSISDQVDCVGGCNADTFKFSRLTSQDIKLGLRWTCCDFTPPPPRYVYTPPPPVYTPPPPLRSKG
jgi:opacity protein-like surface antigen